MNVFDSVEHFRKVFVSFYKMIVVFLMMLTLLRFMNYFLSREHFVEASVLQLCTVFLTGVRFDLLVMGFVFMPVMLVMILQTILKFWSEKMRHVYRTYWGTFWISTCFINFADLPFYFYQGRHVRGGEIFDFSFFPFILSQLGYTSILLVQGIIVFILLLGFKFIFAWALPKVAQTVRLTPANPKDYLQALFKLLFPIFVVALCARGTLTPHHLEKQHSEITDNERLNELALNPLWAIDKN